MRPEIKTYKETSVSELAKAISSFDIGGVASLLSDDGKFSIQDEKFEIIISDRAGFLTWLSECYKRRSFTGKFRRRLRFNIIQCLHCVAGNPIIVFEEGRFPLFSGNQAKNEKSGLVIKSDENKITRIEFCFLIMKTESPYIYERRCLIPVL